MSLNNCKFDWYQTDSSIVISIAKKDLSIEDCQILYNEKTKELQILWKNEIIFNYILHKPILVNKKTIKCTPFKLEITIEKLLNERWTCLSDVSDKKSVISNEYKWDSLAKEVEKEEENEGDGVDRLFKQLYRDANDDVKKAMLKSYSESCGTVLSTNWSEVKDKKTEIKPPDCMEFKKY